MGKVNKTKQVCLTLPVDDLKALEKLARSLGLEKSGAVVHLLRTPDWRAARQLLIKEKQDAAALLLTKRFDFRP
jgi:hypothetical protein